MGPPGQDVFLGRRDPGIRRGVSDDEHVGNRRRLGECYAVDKNRRDLHLQRGREPFICFLELLSQPIGVYRNRQHWPPFPDYFLQFFSITFGRILNFVRVDPANSVTSGMAVTPALAAARRDNGSWMTWGRKRSTVSP